jgi:hypothetical protein
LGRAARRTGQARGRAAIGPAGRLLI